MEKRTTIEDKASILNEEFADRKTWNTPIIRELEAARDTMATPGTGTDGGQAS
jgi:hypothetical protein